MHHRVEDYERDTGSTFPPFRMVSDVEADGVRCAFAVRLGLDRSASGLATNLAISRRSFAIGSVHEEQHSLDIARELSKFDIVSYEHVFLDWGRFDPVFEMLIEDASNTFMYLWYPAAEDLAVFDASCDWMLLFLHYGEVQLLKF